MHVSFYKTNEREEWNWTVLRGILRKDGNTELMRKGCLRDDQRRETAISKEKEYQPITCSYRGQTRSEDETIEEDSLSGLGQLQLLARVSTYVEMQMQTFVICTVN